MQQKIRTEDAKESTVRNLFFVWEYPLQCSCLENPRDRGAWWAAVYGVAQSQTRLKRLSSSSSLCFMYRLLNTHTSTHLSLVL